MRRREKSSLSLSYHGIVNSMIRERSMSMSMSISDLIVNQSNLLVCPIRSSA
nr:hypothetical protein Q903MT_gene3185 [Picea sitchensis]